MATDYNAGALAFSIQFIGHPIDNQVTLGHPDTTKCPFYHFGEQMID